MMSRLLRGLIPGLTLGLVMVVSCQAQEKALGSWQPMPELDQAPRALLAMDDWLLLITQSNLYRSQDGENWQPMLRVDNVVIEIDGIDTAENLFAISGGDGYFHIVGGNGLFYGRMDPPQLHWAEYWPYDPTVSVSVVGPCGWSAISSFGSSSGPHRTTNSINWSRALGDLVLSYSPRGVVADAANPCNTCYYYALEAGGYGGRVNYRTVNGGANWTRISKTVYASYVVGGQSVALGLSDASFDQGSSWHDYHGLAKSICFTLDPMGDRLYAAGINEGLYFGGPVDWQRADSDSDLAFNSLAVFGEYIYGAAERLYRLPLAVIDGTVPTPTPTVTTEPTPTNTPAPIVADINTDGRVDVKDLLLLMQDWQRSN